MALPPEYTFIIACSKTGLCLTAAGLITSIAIIYLTISNLVFSYELYSDGYRKRYYFKDKEVEHTGITIEKMYFRLAKDRGVTVVFFCGDRKITESFALRGDDLENLAAFCKYNNIPSVGAEHIMRRV